MNLGSHRKQMLSVSLVLLLAGAWARGAAEYGSPQSLDRQLADLARREPNVVRVRELAESREKRRAWLVEVGLGSDTDRPTRPALLVVAGIEGNDLAGPFTAVAWLERLTAQARTDPPVAEMLKKTTIYAVPCLNPDALERFFASPRVQLSGNNMPRDDDHDGFVDEDPGEDLNGDGAITQMRVEDREGEYIPDPNESRLLVKADPLQGERGAWKLLPEGIDNDRDKHWNEDGPGGANFNRSFPYNYRYFAPEVGLHPVGDDETRALADFIVSHPNIGIVLTYGAADNLRGTPKAAKSPGRSKPMEAVDERDMGYFEVMGKLYRKVIGLDKEMETVSEPGTFSDWMYFHRGRLSLAVRPWDAALARALAKPKKTEDGKRTTEDEEEKPAAGSSSDPNDAKGDRKSARKEQEKRGAEQRQDLAWFDRHAPEAFVPWQTIEHPDFPGRRVEVGGYRPFAQTNPPAALLAGIATQQGDFLTELARRLPRIGIGKVECHLLAESIYEIEIQVVNSGFLPTALAHGETTQEVYPTRVIVDLEPACFLAGARTTSLPAIRGSGGTAKVRCTIRVADRSQVQFQVVSMLGGRAEGTIELLKTTAENR
ncbi:MAG: M14 family metallopeptidase [Planctomycetes bacterium]|nr:M14 family metallopeptidase [Planctomycetota bacterium]